MLIVPFYSMKFSPQQFASIMVDTKCCSHIRPRLLTLLEFLSRINWLVWAHSLGLATKLPYSLKPILLVRGFFVGYTKNCINNSPCIKKPIMFIFITHILVISWKEWIIY